MGKLAAVCLIVSLVGCAQLIGLEPGEEVDGGSTTSGTGGGTPAAVGHDAVGLVNAGTVAKGGPYRMVFTLGQPAPAQKTFKNGSFRLEGGLVGATETP